MTEYHTEPVLRVASIKQSMKKYKIMTYLFCQAAWSMNPHSLLHFILLSIIEVMTVAVAVCRNCSRLVERVFNFSVLVKCSF